MQHPEIDLARSARRITAIRAHVGAGTATVDWWLRGQLVYTGHRITTKRSRIVLDPPLRVWPTDQLQPRVIEGDGKDLVVAVDMEVEDA